MRTRIGTENPNSAVCKVQPQPDFPHRDLPDAIHSLAEWFEATSPQGFPRWQGPAENCIYQVQDGIHALLTALCNRLDMFERPHARPRG